MTETPRRKPPPMRVVKIGWLRVTEEEVDIEVLRREDARSKPSGPMIYTAPHGADVWPFAGVRRWVGLRFGFCQ